MIFFWPKTPAGWRRAKPLCCHQEKDWKGKGKLYFSVRCHSGSTALHEHEQRTGCHWPTITSVHGASALNASCSSSAFAHGRTRSRDAVVWWLSVFFLQCNWLRLIFLYSSDGTHFFMRSRDTSCRRVVYFYSLGLIFISFLRISAKFQNKEIFLHIHICCLNCLMKR